MEAFFIKIISIGSEHTDLQIGRVIGSNPVSPTEADEFGFFCFKKFLRYLAVGPLSGSTLIFSINISSSQISQWHTILCDADSDASLIS